MGSASFRRRIQTTGGARNPAALTVLLGLIALFLILIVANAYQAQVSQVKVSYIPNNPRPGEPVEITVTVDNPLTTADYIHTDVYVNGQTVLTSTALLLPGQSQSLTYTTGAPQLGQVIRASAVSWPASTGAQASGFALIPQSPPEAWMSFMAFSSFAISLVSSTTTTLTSTFTMTYYANTMNLASPVVPGVGSVNMGVVLSVTLVSLLIFVELTDRSYGQVHPKLAALRGRYGLIAANLLLVFVGIVATKIILVIHG